MVVSRGPRGSAVSTRGLRGLSVTRGVLAGTALAGERGGSAGEGVLPVGM